MYHRRADAWKPPAGVDVVRTRTWELSRLFRRAYRVATRDSSRDGATIEPLRAGAAGSLVRAVLRELVYVPDAQIGWLPFALRAAAGIMRRYRPEVVYTTSVPFTAHVVGAILQRRFGVPWVAEFRDLWTGSQTGQARTSARRALDRRMEEEILRRADAVVVTTEAARDALAAAHPRADPARIRVVTNAFEAAAHPRPTPPAPSAPLLLVHAGSLTPAVQDPAPLLAAAARLESRAADSVRIRVFGPEAPWREAMDRIRAPASLVELRGLVSPARVPAELALASAVLLLAPGAPFRPVVLGKTFEWLGSGVPALAVVDPAGMMADLVRRSHGGIVVPANDDEALGHALRTMLDEQRRGTLRSLAPDAAVAAEFEARNVTRRLGEVFDGVLPASGRRRGSEGQR
jgi:glycosyltransferase involved in cell wall biosynthesis